MFPEANTDWNMIENKMGINHFAICYPSREDFLDRLQVLQDMGIEFRQRGNHGMTHSVYVSDPDGNGVEFLHELPESVWIGDVNAALDFWEDLDPEDALEDPTDYKVFAGAES